MSYGCSYHEAYLAPTLTFDEAYLSPTLTCIIIYLFIIIIFFCIVGSSKISCKKWLIKFSYRTKIQ